MRCATCWTDSASPWLRGWPETPSRMQVATALGGPPEAAILGSPVTVSAPAAALANGALVHAWDFDDTHADGLVHATAVVLPAVLAVGQQHDVSGADALAAAVAGDETVCRIAAASPHGFHARGLHATAVCGVFSAALVAAKLAARSARCGSCTGHRRQRGPRPAGVSGRREFD